MTRILGPVLAVLLALLVLFGLELGGSFTRLGHVFGVFYMRVGEAGRLSGFFAIAALFWLLILLGMGSMDAMTRTNFPVTVTEYP